MRIKAKDADSMRDIAVLFGTLMFFWVLLANTLAVDTLLIGAVISLGIALFYRSGLSFFTEFRATPAAFAAGVRFYALFFQEMVKANLRLMRIVIAPALPIRPGIVKVRTRLKSRMGRLMLANSITLTPGTLTVDIVDEWLYVHWVAIESDDIDEATAKLVAGFEQHLEIMYG